MSEIKAQQPVSRPGITGRFTIEMGDELAHNVFWPMTKQVLRGRWSRMAMIGRGGMPELLKMPDWPGIRVEVNVATRTARIYDPLAAKDARTEQLVREISPLYAKINGSEGRPWDEQTYPDLNATDLKSWLFWMKRIVVDGKAVEVQCTLPKMEGIESMPGKILIEPMNSSQTALKYKEDIERARELAHNQQLGIKEEVA